MAIPRGPDLAGSLSGMVGRPVPSEKRTVTGVARLMQVHPANLTHHFKLLERVGLIRQAVAHPAVEVQSFEGLLVDFAKRVGASLLVRGLRAVSDFEYEFQMALMNRHLAPTLETVFLVPAFDLTYLSSSMVREAARHGGDVSQLVHPAVANALKQRFRAGAAPAT